MIPGASFRAIVGFVVLVTIVPVGAAAPLAPPPGLPAPLDGLVAGLLDVLTKDVPDTLRRAVLLADAGAELQASAIALDPARVSIPYHDRPSMAAAELAARYGLALDANISGRLDAVAAPRELTRVIDAFLAFDTAGHVPVDVAAVFAARHVLLHAIVDLRAALGTIPVQAPPCDPIRLAPAFSFDLESCDETYTTNIALLIDGGGGDVYQNNAGGSNVFHQPRGRGGCFGSESNVVESVGALIDLGGDDTYGDTSSPLFCGVNGGAVNGVGFLLDDGGSDIYVGGQAGVNGGAVAGVGFLLDAAGNDTYTAVADGVNGGAETFGVGFLLDASGDDTYDAGFQTDLSPGANGGALFGNGFLFDGGGNDVYLSGSQGTNGGSLFGTGFLIDVSGDDTYRAGDAGANGGAVGGTGLLLDLGGHDAYSDTEILSGTGDDTTVVGKGPGAGAQIDVPLTG